MLVGIASVKGSPGVTTTVLGLAMMWPGASTLLVEADPSGGDIAVWRRLARSPGLTTLARAARRTPAAPATGPPVGEDRVLAHAHDLGQHVYAVPAPVGGEQARAAVESLASRPGLLRSTVGLGGAVNTAMVDVVVVDLGRIEPGSVALPLTTDLDVLLLMAPGSVTGLAHLAARPPILADATLAAPHVGVLLVRQGGFRPREVEETIGLPLLGILPEDVQGAQFLAGTASIRPRHGLFGSRLASRPLAEALRQLTDRLQALPARSRQITPERPRTAAEAGWTRPAPR